MERRVKERLIGASILVALIVLVVPELLSGPKPATQSAKLPMNLPASAAEQTRSVTVDLSTSKPPANPDVDAASSPPAAPAPPASAPAASPPTVAIYGPSSAAPRAAAPAPTPVESPANPPTSVHAAWFVQLGSFANRANADKLARQLKGQGFSVYVVSGGSGASVRYRARIGPLADRGSAERTVTKLKSIGHASSLVAPAR